MYLIHVMIILGGRLSVESGVDD